MVGWLNGGSRWWVMLGEHGDRRARGPSWPQRGMGLRAQQGAATNRVPPVVRCTLAAGSSTWYGQPLVADRDRRHHRGRGMQVLAGVRSVDTGPAATGAAAALGFSLVFGRLLVQRGGPGGSVLGAFHVRGGAVSGF